MGADGPLYEKYLVQRTDGKDNEGKHTDCEYFVLDLSHDPYAPSAILAYAKAALQTHPILAQQLTNKANQIIAARKGQS